MHLGSARGRAYEVLRSSVRDRLKLGTERGQDLDVVGGVIEVQVANFDVEAGMAFLECLSGRLGVACGFGVLEENHAVHRMQAHQAQDGAFFFKSRDRPFGKRVVIARKAQEHARHSASIGLHGHVF